ncbi:MAG TPA: winged helix-turn-helix domain-containing protein, partial [Nitrososphaeraceae archaeon]
MNTRGKDEVIGLILEAAKEGASRTNIMYKSFVSYGQLEELLGLLLENNLLNYEKGQLVYRTTEKGIQFLQQELNQKKYGNNNSDDDDTTLLGLTTTTTTTNNNAWTVSDKHFDKILVIGLGQLGLPVARYIKEKGGGGGFDVYGYDISSKAMERAEKTAGIKKATDFSGFDVYIICVSTHKPEDMFSPQIDGLL